MPEFIYFPVNKLPVPPDQVDCLKIKLLESVFDKDETGKIKEYRKIYFETLFEGKKVTDGNNIIPSELIPLIFDAENNKEIISYALHGFGFSLNQERFLANPDIFSNQSNIIHVNITQNESETNPQITTPSHVNIEPSTTSEPTGNEPSTAEPTGNEPTEPSTTEPTGSEPTIAPAN